MFDRHLLLILQRPNNIRVGNVLSMKYFIMEIFFLFNIPSTSKENKSNGNFHSVLNIFAKYVHIIILLDHLQGRHSHFHYAQCWQRGSNLGLLSLDSMFFLLHYRNLLSIADLK